jgi:O-methyltransferase involved in polyketide biosynthesis
MSPVYLTKEENSSLINYLFTKVPSGSSIVFDYADEKLFEEKGMSNRVENMVKMASASGELIYEHLPPAAINDLFFSNRTDYLTAFETIHYIHAIKK